MMAHNTSMLVTSGGPLWDWQSQKYRTHDQVRLTLYVVLLQGAISHVTDQEARGSTMSAI